MPVPLALKELGLLKKKLVLLIQGTFCFCEVGEDIIVDLPLFIDPFTKHLFSTYCVPGAFFYMLGI